MKTDLRLQQDVMEELQFEPSVDAAGIGVTAKDGIVSLSGKAKNYSEKMAAARATERVLGVRALVDELKVELPYEHQRDDEEIAKAAVRALHWDVQVPDTRIIVKVENGYITLDGNVDYKFQQLAEVNAVQNLMGVTGVLNLIHLKPPATAFEVKLKIESALQRAAETDSQHINVNVADDKVTLKGTVRSWAARNEAERAAWSAPGVRMVEDDLKVSA